MKIFARWKYRKFFYDGLGNAEFMVTGLGVDEVYHLGMVRRPQGTEDFLLLLFAPADDHAGRAILFHPGDKQEYGTTGRAWKHSWLMFRGRHLAGYLEQQRIMRSRYFEIDYHWCVKVLSLIQYEVELPEVNSQLLYHLFELWVNRFAAGMQTQSVIPQRIRQAALLLTREGRPPTLSAAAKTSFLSVSRFSEEFKKYYGASPLEYAHRGRMAQAKFMLRNHSLSVKDIALQLGYQNQFYFSARFKKYFGVPPQEYRKTNQTLSANH